MGSQDKSALNLGATALLRRAGTAVWAVSIGATPIPLRVNPPVWSIQIMKMPDSRAEMGAVIKPCIVPNSKLGRPFAKLCPV